MGNTYMDLFTSNCACMKNVVEKLVEKIPNAVVDYVDFD